MSDTVQVYEGEHVRVLYDGSRCIHARACVTGLPEVFRANVDGPWIEPDAAEPDEIRALARRCPSGAIRVEPTDGVAPERPPLRNTVAPLENGPLAFRADLRIVGQDPRIRATLCRCGASRRKPFCDGSHDDVSFRASGEPPAEPLGAAPEPGPLTVTPLKDGPLLVTGPLEVVRGGLAKAVKRCTRVALCRCGSSENKPYCDGTHAKIGFKAD